jgi:hypothetical protein
MASTSSAKKRAADDWQNRESADIILADPEKYGGPESLPVQWAGAVARMVNWASMAARVEDARPFIGVRAGRGDFA